MTKNTATNLEETDSSTIAPLDVADGPAEEWNTRATYAEVVRSNTSDIYMLM